LKVGITDGFIRVSCGIEDADDLIRALERAMEKV
jgi:cystathionine beta-lyase/cystathionine gamma-synthase